MEILILIGTALIGLVSFFRFNIPPASLLDQHDNETLGHRLQRWFSFNTGQATLFPPPRANTTLFKYSVYRFAYIVSGILVYLALLRVPGLGAEVDKIIAFSMKSANMEVDQFPLLSTSGPVMVAFLLSVILPKLPPFASADIFIRSYLYERAAIPAQQFRELQRLKETPYRPNEECLAQVRDTLRAEGFNPADLVIDEIPTTRSLWTKLALLMRHLQKWSGDGQYQTAFSAIRQIDDSRRTLDVVDEMYKALMGDAKRVLAEQNQPGTDMSDTEHAFRHSVKTVLYHAYNLLSRVSLHAHYSEAERVRCLREIGFQLNRRRHSSTPDANDLVMLMLIIGFAMVMPLSILMRNPALAPLIGIIIFSAVLLPIFIAGMFPTLLSHMRTSTTPNVAFPVLCALITACFSALLMCTYLLIKHGDIAMVIGEYSTRWPWAIIHAGIAVLVAWRIQVKVEGTYRVGNIIDAAIFSAVSLVLMGLVFFLLDQKGSTPPVIWAPFLVIGTVSGLIGFFAPTWYRNNNYHHVERRSRDRQAFNNRLQRHLTSSYHT